jgi:AcrR family transcriptional regulator
MRDRGATRGRIEAAALRLFVERGVGETGIREIAAATGLSEGAMYRHFAGKDALVFELFSAGFAAFARELDRLHAAATGTHAKCDAMVRGFCALFDADPVLFRFILLVQHGQAAKITPDMPNPIEIVRTVIEQGMKRREIPRGDIDLMTAMVMGIILQTATAKVYGRIRPTLTKLAPTLAAACWRVLAGIDS